MVDAVEAELGAEAKSPPIAAGLVDPPGFFILLVEAVGDCCPDGADTFSSQRSSF